jgi:hypothetical protein
MLLVGLVCTGMLGMPGCKGEPARPQENKAAGHLRTIAQAFDLAIDKRRVPQNVEELKPFLQQLSGGEDVEVLLRSPNDGQPYEIMWGVNLEREEAIDAIFAHEKLGVAGRRYVITVSRIVKQIGDDEFSKASFARGKKPARGK